MSEPQQSHGPKSPGPGFELFISTNFSKDFRVISSVSDGPQGGFL
jgi:hypothetical protein